MAWYSYVNAANMKRGLNMLPYYLIEGNNVQTKELEKLVRGTKTVTAVTDAAGNTKKVTSYVGGRGYKNFGGSLKASMLAAENSYKKAIAANGGSTWQYLRNAVTNTPKEIAAGWNVGGRAAKIAGKSGFLGALKGAGKAILKRMPFIGTALYALTTLPNIFKATKEGGLATGATEVLKTTASITGFTVGCAIGSALCPIPIVGGILGGIIGGMITDKVVGKSYTDMKAEIEQKALEKAQTQGFDTGSTNPFAMGLTPEQQYQLAMLQQGKV